MVENITNSCIINTFVIVVCKQDKKVRMNSQILRWRSFHIFTQMLKEVQIGIVHMISNNNFLAYIAQGQVFESYSSNNDEDTRYMVPHLF